MIKIREIITFTSIDERKLVLPLQYNYLIQGMIYNLLDKDLAKFLHDKGFLKGSRSFKMFTFSRLIGDYVLDKQNSNIIFKCPISLTICSPFNDFCNSIGNSLLTRDKIQLGKTYVKVKEITLEKESIKHESIKAYTLSPIVVYSTLYKADGKKFTCYFQPGETEFNRLLEKNLKKKYEAFYKEKAPEGNVTIKFLKQPKLSVVNYKNTVIKGYSGKFILSAPKPILHIALDSGLGSKNSQGFGCIKMINN